MSDYNRSTIECSVRQLRPELRRALDDYFQKNSLGDIETETVLCCETVSERKEPNWLASLFGEKVGPPIYTAVLLTSAHLVWARGNLQSDIKVTGADLKFIRAKPYTSMFLSDNGLQVSGIIGNSATASGYIGMGPEPAAQKFCEEVQKAIVRINPAAARKWPSWMGGGQQ
jgi:hypothetical protein